MSLGHYITNMATSNYSQYRIAIITAVVGTVCLAIYEAAKENIEWSSVPSVFAWAWTHIFLYTLPVWQILLVLILGFSMLSMIVRLRAKDIGSSSVNLPDWLEYTHDSFADLTWKWNWQKNISGRWSIQNLTPICGKCGTRMQIYIEDNANCPRCDNRISRFKTTAQIEAIILDNVERGNYNIHN